jgi:hypothetical protein
MNVIIKCAILKLFSWVNSFPRVKRSLSDKQIKIKINTEKKKPREISGLVVEAFGPRGPLANLDFCWPISGLTALKLIPSSFLFFFLLQLLSTPPDGRPASSPCAARCSLVLCFGPNIDNGVALYLADDTRDSLLKFHNRTVIFFRILICHAGTNKLNFCSTLNLIRFI